MVAAVEAGEVDRGVIPFENSSNGTVIPTLDTLSTAHLECSDITIAGETTLTVSHCLLVRSAGDGQITPPDSPASEASPVDTSGPTLATEQLKKIKHVYSHPQALGQCRDFLAQTLPWAELHHTTSTAEAAVVASKDVANASAAIGSAVTARRLGLQVLQNNVQDIKDNTTRFLILKKDPLNAPPWHTQAHFEHGETRRMLVSFAIDTREHSKLGYALKTFNKPHIHLGNVHSRPSRKSPYHYVYFAEVEWCVDKDGGQEVNEALRDLGKVAQSRRCHGSWGPTLEW